MSVTATLEPCRKCGAETSTQGFCPACMLDRGWIEEENSEVATLELKAFDDYELMEEIARGGMGVVYKARQKSLNRTVAIKMVLAWRLARRSDLQRFKAEAETAAGLQHPNIVAIHEVGELDGQPFFSMDYVEGKSLAELSHNEPLATKRAAAYLKTIAEGVSYAHSKGILHRDLKPSNILIDQNEQPRITDFGLAKRLDDFQESTLNDPLTVTGQVLGSPNFMPPEQATGDRKAVGPASDVYSLGAILYQLLTGRPPFMAETLAQTLRMVAETEPVPPRLLNAVVPEDLNTICLKCLQKEPLKRYTTAQALIEDLGRYLRDEPILARPASPVEKAWRWCRRNPGLAGALTMVAALLLAVAIGSPIVAVRLNGERRASDAARKKAVEQEATARTEAAKSEQVAQFLKDMLAGVGPSVAMGRDTTLLREILDKTAERVGRDLTNQPQVEFELWFTLAAAYSQSLQFDKANKLGAEALKLATNLYGETNLLTARALSLVAQTRIGRAQGNDFVDAENLARRALNIRRTLLGDESSEVADSRAVLANALQRQRKYKEAEEYHRAALEFRRRWSPESPQLAGSLNALALVLTKQGKHVEAMELLKEAEALYRRLNRSESLELAGILRNLAEALGHQARWAEEEPVLRQVIAMRRKFLPRPEWNAETLGMLGYCLRKQGKVAEAEVAYRESASMAVKLWLTEGDSYPKQAEEVLYELASVLLQENKTNEAVKVYEDFLTPTVLARPDSRPFLVGRGRVLAGIGRLEEAAADLAKSRLAPQPFTAPPRPVGCPDNLIDLTVWFNAGLTNSWHDTRFKGNDLGAISNGVLKLGEVSFDVRGIIQLSAAAPALEYAYPLKVPNIRIERRCSALHFLHAVGWTEQKGVRVGEYTIHRTDRSSETVPLIYGENTADWFADPDQAMVEGKTTRTAWRGQNAASRSFNQELRLYEFVWQNSMPDQEISTIDFSSALSTSGPFLVAITAEP